MNSVEAVAIIIAVFFIAGLMVGFLIVMALSAHGGGRGNGRGGSRRVNGGQRPREPGARRPGWPEPRRRPGAGPSGTDPDGEDSGAQTGARPGR